MVHYTTFLPGSVPLFKENVQCEQGDRQRKWASLAPPQQLHFRHQEDLQGTTVDMSAKWKNLSIARGRLNTGNPLLRTPGTCCVKSNGTIFIQASQPLKSLTKEATLRAPICQSWRDHKQNQVLWIIIRSRKQASMCPCPRNIYSTCSSELSSRAVWIGRCSKEPWPELFNIPTRSSHE